jgi:N-methylhydantoinase B
MFLLKDAIASALSKVVPEMVPAPHVGSDALHIAGSRSDGTEFSTWDLIWGSWGARPKKDGEDAASPSSYSGIAAELLENQVPVVVEEVTTIQDSGGPGRYRGGLSVVKSYTFLQDTSIMIRTIRDVDGAPGMMGGHAGAPPNNILIRRDGTMTSLPSRNHLHLDVGAGDRLRHETGGAGGHGSPLSRTRTLVLRDVALGKVSPEGALRDYGVVVGANELGVVDEFVVSFATEEPSCVPVETVKGQGKNG